MKDDINRIIIFLGSVLLLFFLISQIMLAKQDTQTTDEVNHISAGYTYLTKKEVRFNPEHPILTKSWELKKNIIV